MPRAALSYAAFMASPAGRLIRIAAGIALMLWGWANWNGPAGAWLMVVGVFPIVAGVFNFCILAPLLRVPFSGSEARAAAR